MIWWEYLGDDIIFSLQSLHQRFQVGSVVPRRESHINVNVTPQHDYGADTPEIRKYKKRFNSEILCAALWGVNLLIGTENGLMLLDRCLINSCIMKS